VRPTDDPDWQGGMEPDIGVVVVRMEVDRNAAQLVSRCIVTFSLHAVARRLQRHPDGSIEAVLYDFNLAAQAASGGLVAGAGYRVRTDGHGGGWRGRVINHTLADGSQRPVLAIRTWLDR
jgi:hypothetical protein